MNGVVDHTLDDFVDGIRDFLGGHIGVVGKDGECDLIAVIRGCVSGKRFDTPE
jgi:hypothetical protein